MRHLPLRSELLPALRVPDGRVVRREVGVRELQLPAVGTRTAAAALRLDVFEALASVGLYLFAAQEHLAFEPLAQELGSVNWGRGKGGRSDWVGDECDRMGEVGKNSVFRKVVGCPSPLRMPPPRIIIVVSKLVSTPAHLEVSRSSVYNP